MTSKYSLAKEAIAEVAVRAAAAKIDLADAYDALLISLISHMKEEQVSNDLRALLQVEIDNLGSGGIYELPRGGGHS